MARGRYAQKRQRNAVAKVVVGIGESPEVESLIQLIHRDIQSGRADAADFAQIAANSPTKAAELILAALREAQGQLLANYKRSLEHRSSKLTVSGCWEFLFEKLPTAQIYGIEAELRHLVFDHAGEFADARMLATTKKYHRYAR